jgi:hypothetical protein
MSKYESKVVKAFFSKNYQVEFSIDHQTFRLEEVKEDEGNNFKISSKDKAEWYKKQLDAAFERLMTPKKD